jgi:hypothetical protein
MTVAEHWEGVVLSEEARTVAHLAVPAKATHPGESGDDLGEDHSDRPP